MSGDAIITLRGVSREYASRRTGRMGLSFRLVRKIVYRDLDLEIPAGRTVGITGDNGSGKTTLMKLMAGLHLPTRGTVTVGGHDPVGEPALARAAVGFSPASERSLFWRLSGQQNLDLLSSMDGVRHDADYHARLAGWAELLDLTAALPLRVEEYSAGMREKLGYIASLIPRPDVLIYDDFGKNLDTPGIERLWGRLREDLAAGRHRGLVISSPRRALLERMVDQVLVVGDGGVREEVMA